MRTLGMIGRWFLILVLLGGLVYACERAYIHVKAQEAFDNSIILRETQGENRKLKQRLLTMESEEFEVYSTLKDKLPEEAREVLDTAFATMIMRREEHGRAIDQK